MRADMFICNPVRAEQSVWTRAPNVVSFPQGLPPQGIFHGTLTRFGRDWQVYALCSHFHAASSTVAPYGLDSTCLWSSRHVLGRYAI